MIISVDFTSIEERDAFLDESRPEGLDISIEVANEDTVSAAVFTILVQVVQPLSLNLIACWLYDMAVKHKSKSISVDGYKPADKAEFHRIVTGSDLEIGKND